MHRNAKYKNGTKFNPGLMLIGLPGTGSFCEAVDINFSSLSPKQIMTRLFVTSTFKSVEEIL